MRGWRRTVLQKCGARRRPKKTLAGADGIGNSNPMRSGSGSNAWARRAGPCRNGRVSTAAADSRASEAKILREEMRKLGLSLATRQLRNLDARARAVEVRIGRQKREHLPKIARGEIRWCQGYSEPGSGSDLASLQTRAEDKGDQFLVNGSKIWTSYADKADWIFCLVRTDPNAPKHEGISFLLFDMESPGVSTKPITLDLGHVAVLPDFLRRRAGAQGEPRRQAQQGMGYREVPARRMSVT